MNEECAKFVLDLFKKFLRDIFRILLSSSGMYMNSTFFQGVEIRNSCSDFVGNLISTITKNRCWKHLRTYELGKNSVFYHFKDELFLGFILTCEEENRWRKNWEGRVKKMWYWSTQG